MTYGSFVSHFALDTTKSGIFQDRLCWILFSNVSWFGSAIRVCQQEVQGFEHFLPHRFYSIQLFTFFRRGFLGFWKRNKPQTCLRHKNAVWFVSLPWAAKFIHSSNSALVIIIRNRECRLGSDHSWHQHVPIIFSCIALAMNVASFSVYLNLDP